MSEENKGSDTMSHQPGVSKGEEQVENLGKEPGRGDSEADRTARDSTSINPEDREPISDEMPEMPRA